MQFGIFSVSDITPDPTTGRTPTEAERIKAVLTIAQKAEEVGLDVFARGEHHNPPLSPTTGRAPPEPERIKAVLPIAQKAEEAGLDVFALAEPHTPPFFSSSPTTT